MCDNREESRKQVSPVQPQQHHFTWFPRKNYNKSRRHGADEHEEKETEQEDMSTEVCIFGHFCVFLSSSELVVSANGCGGGECDVEMMMVK